MTEYATDPEAIQEYLTARDRTANWVNVHSTGLNFVSPSSPPSIISDSDAPSVGPSESDSASTHSIPPRMLLRYPDGRHVPISSDGVSSPTHSRSHHTYGPQSSSRHTHSRSGSHAPPAAGAPAAPSARYAQTLSYATGSRYAPSAHQQQHIEPPRSPESIRILPSRQPDELQSPVRMSASSSSHQSRGTPPAQGVFQPQPRHPSIHPSQHADRVPPLADPLHTSNRSTIAPTPRQGPAMAQASYAGAPGGIAHSQSQPASLSHSSGSRFIEHAGTASRAPSQLPYTYSPPAIVYAPSSRHKGSNYNPPAIVYSPSHGHHHRQPAPGIAYSRSDPLPHPTQYSPVQTNAGNTPFPSVHGSVSHHSQHHSRRDSPPREESRRSRASSAVRGRPPAREFTYSQTARARTRSPTPSLSPSDTASDTSGSTYYVLPSPGQKVQIIVPNAASVYTASGGRSPRSPGSGSSSGSPKKPFFQRLFSRGSGSVDSRGSSSQGKRLRRRHTVGGTHLHASTSSRQ